MLTLYQAQLSGNSYKVRLMMALTRTRFRVIDINVLEGENRQADYLARNPDGRLPLLQLEDGRLLPESNAALFYLADGTPYLPADRFDRANVLQWMFFEQFGIATSIAPARFWWTLKPGGRQKMREQFPLWHERGHQALGVMEQHLKVNEFFVNNQCTIADIALYAYCHVADQGGFDLNQYPAVQAWLARISALPDYVDLLWRPD